MVATKHGSYVENGLKMREVTRDPVWRDSHDQMIKIQYIDLPKLRCSVEHVRPSVLGFNDRVLVTESRLIARSIESERQAIDFKRVNRNQRKQRISSTLLDSPSRELISAKRNDNNRRRLTSGYRASDVPESCVQHFQIRHRRRISRIREVPDDYACFIPNPIRNYPTQGLRRIDSVNGHAIGIFDDLTT